MAHVSLTLNDADFDWFHWPGFPWFPLATAGWCAKVLADAKTMRLPVATTLLTAHRRTRAHGRTASGQAEGQSPTGKVENSPRESSTPTLKSVGISLKESQQ